jgi:hypothetical protein
MNIVTTITTALASLNIPMAVGQYETDGKPYPDAYIVIMPLYEVNEDIADDTEASETHGADVGLFIKGDYTVTKNSAKTLLKSAGLFIAEARYVGFETGHHHISITVEEKEFI